MLSLLSVTPGYFSPTDASDNWSCGAVFCHQWFQWQWPPEWTNEAIMAKELVPIVPSIAVWGPYLKKNFNTAAK